MKSGDDIYDRLQDDLRTAKLSADPERIAKAEEAVKQYGQHKLQAAQQAYMQKFLDGLLR